jgi:phosphoribosylanthranilate isomerase
MRVKICGMTHAEDVAAAVEAGADAVGFILYHRSKRFVSLDEAVELARHVPPYVQRVAVTVNASLEELAAIRASAQFDWIQLHGDESPELCRDLAARGFRILKALGLPRALPAPPAAHYGVPAFLLDKAAPEYGGTGETFDWNLAVAFQNEAGVPCVLSGGLTPENVVQAIGTVHPYAVDVCSGVESVPGRKDHAKMLKFITLCRSN